MAKYIFPAVFDPNECGGFTVTFPDLQGCITEGDTLEESIQMASEALALHLYDFEAEGDPIPEPTRPALINMPADSDPGAFVTLIQARTEPIRDSIQNRAVKKTLTVPHWLSTEAEAAGINFSQVLQQALKEQLGLTPPGGSSHQR